MKVPEQLQFLVNARAPQHRSDARMDGSVVVITGATSGVGYQAARRFAAGGARLVLVCRNREKADRLRAELATEFGSAVSCVIADFSRLAEVRAAGAQILAENSAIDVLVNNAGVHMTRRELTPDGNEVAFGVNHLASFLLTRLLLDRMMKSAPSRIIQVNSQGHRFGGLDLSDIIWERRRYRGIKGYGASKVAQLLTVWELAERLAGSSVTINAMHPGEVRSGIGSNNGVIYRTYARVLIQPLLKDPAISAEALSYLAAAPEMAGVSGRFFNQTIDEKPAAHALDRVLGRAVWDLSERLVGISDPAEPNAGSAS
jgi:NAD(P)-dependent dehydrogenase (short-subunit alcohol dehydrogenase family)